MATPQITPIQDIIHPVMWRTPPPGLGTGKGSKWNEIAGRVERECQSCIPELESIAEDNNENDWTRYRAMGYLVALQNRGKHDAAKLIEFFAKIGRSAKGMVREDAFCAIAWLQDAIKPHPHPQAVAKLIELAKTPDLRSAALIALAERANAETLEPLVLGIIELNEAYTRRELAESVKKIPDLDVPWLKKAECFIQLFKRSSQQRNQVDTFAILQAIKPTVEKRGQTQATIDFFIDAALECGQDERMSGILAALIIECDEGNVELAGHRINAYQQNHGLQASDLLTLRMQMGGTPALSGVMGVLRANLDEYFQKPINQLNEDTRKSWKTALKNATLGFEVRLWMSVVVFAMGAALVAISSFKIFFRQPTPESMESFAAGLAAMLLVVYVGPLTDIRQSVNDLASANAAFIGYVHRVLETSHTFSFYYLKDKISFEELQKSSQLIKDAMDNTVQVLNRKAVDSSQGVFYRLFARSRTSHDGKSEPGDTSDKQ